MPHAFPVGFSENMHHSLIFLNNTAGIPTCESIHVIDVDQCALSRILANRLCKSPE